MASKLAIIETEKPETGSKLAFGESLEEPLSSGQQGLVDAVDFILSDPNEGRNIFKNTSYFSRTLNMPIRDAYALRQVIGKQMAGEDVEDRQISKIIEKIELEEFRPPQLSAAPERGFWGRTWSNIKHNYLNQRDLNGDIARGPFLGLLLGAASTDEINNRDELYEKDFKQAVSDGFSSAGIRMVKSIAGRVQMTGDLLHAEEVSGWGEMMAHSTDLYYAENPGEQIQLKPGTGILGTTVQAIRQPEIIVQGLMEMVPMVAEATLGHIAGTNAAKYLGFGSKALPWFGRVAGIAEPLVGENYANARQQRTEPEKALAQSYLQAYGEGILEEWTLSAKVNIFKGAMGSHVKKSMAKRATDILVGAGKNYQRGFTEEALQSVNSRFWELIFTDNRDYWDAFRESLSAEALEAGTFGGLLEAIAAEGTAIAGQTFGTAADKLARLDGLSKNIKGNPSISTRHKAEIDQVLEEKREEIQQEAAAEALPEQAAAPKQGVSPLEDKDIGVKPTQAKPEAVGKIGKAEEALIQEAKKFKTAGEFVDSNTKVYSFTKSELKNKNIEDFVEGDLIKVDNRYVIRVQYGKYDHPSLKTTVSKLGEFKEMSSTPGVRGGRPYFLNNFISARSEMPTKQSQLIDIYNQAQARPAKPEGKVEAVELPATFGAQNKVFTQDKNAEALARIKERMAKREGFLTGEKGELDVNALKDYVTVGGYYFEAGLRNYPGWSTMMVSKIGERVRLHLETIWQSVQDDRRIKEVAKTKPPGLTKAEIEHLGQRQVKALRAGQKAGEKIGFKAGERASREKAKVEIQKLKAAQRLTEGRRATAVELVRAFIEKENRGDFLKRVAEAKTPKDLEKINTAIEKGVARAEKKDAISSLNKAVKAINPKRMLPEFAGTAQNIIDSFKLGKLRPDTEVNNTDLKEMAQQVLDTAREDSVAAFQAEQLIDELRGKTAKTFAINQLSIEAIEQITDSLIALRFQNEADTIAAKDENAAEAIRRRQEIKQSIVEPPAISEEIGGKQAKQFKLIHDNLESVLDSTAGARPGTYDLWKKAKRATTEFIYDVLNRGVDNQIIHNQTARNILRDILTDNSVTKKQILEWSMRPQDVLVAKKAIGGVWDDLKLEPVVHKFTLQDARGKPAEFEFTVNELMSIFMHAKNNHNLAVLLGDGVDRIIDGKKQKIRGFDVEIIDSMIATLTDQQEKITRQVGSRLMDGFNRDSINETSVKLEFFELAKVENYWPARRSIIRTPKGKQLQGAVKTIEGMGLLKERVGTNNPMRLSGFFETVHSSNKNVSTYVGLAEPLREVKAVYTQDVIEEMENSGRSKEADRITRLLVRIEDQSGVFDPLDTAVKRMIGGFAKSKLFLNVKIAPRQQLSSQLLSAYIDTKYFAEFRGIATKGIIDEISLLSPQTKARFEGFQFDRDVGDAFQQNELMSYLTGVISFIDHAAIGMKFFDTNAIVDIYRAAKAEVSDKNPDIDINSDEGQVLLKDRFEWLVRHTQPMWQVKDRSLLGSDPRAIVRSLTMFMSQREQLVRMINNSISDFANSEKTTQDATRLGKVLGSVALNMALFTMYNLAWSALIHKKKRDVWDLVKNFMKDILSLPFFGKYMAKSFELVFNIFADKPVFFQEFDDGAVESILKEIFIEAIPNYARAGKHFVTKEKYRGEEKWKNELLVAVDATAEAFASLRGIPYYGAKDLVRSVKAQLTEDENDGSKSIGKIGKE